MDLQYKTLKPFFLMAAIAIGFCVQANNAKAADRQTITFAGGCFWCVEADFEDVEGVLKAVSGFSGGTVENPSYKQVVRGGTGHLEVVQITYDADVVSTRTLLDLFFRSIDPTDAGGQFCDRGETYTTAVFVDDIAQRSDAEAAKAAAQAELGRQIVTPIREFDEFYRAENYHQDYYKSTKLIPTRFGLKSKKEAYKRYRKGCGRDDRVKAIWGEAAPFAS